MLLALVLAAMIDAPSGRFLAACNKELTDECGAYLQGFVDGMGSYDWAARELKARDSRIVVPKLACLPRFLDMEEIRVATVKAVRAKPLNEPLASWVLATVSKLHPCKVKE